MGGKRIKKRYQKPLINQVNLASEEAVLTACKIGQTGEDKGSGRICGGTGFKCVDAGT